MRDSKKIRDNARRLLGVLTLCGLMAGCASVDITKNSPEVYPPTDPNTVQIIRVTPYRSYQELGSLDVSGFDSLDTDEMQKAIRAEAADVGADAVILEKEGLIPSGGGDYDRWATGVVIRYNSASE